MVTSASSRWSRRRANEIANRTTTARLSARCVSPVRKAVVPRGMASRSRKPNTAATTAPRMPMPMSRNDPFTYTSASPDRCDTRSNTMLATHAPMGTVTRMGWNGWPYGPARGVTGRLAARSPPVGTVPSDRVLVSIGTPLTVPGHGDPARAGPQGLAVGDGRTPPQMANTLASPKPRLEWWWQRRSRSTTALAGTAQAAGSGASERQLGIGLRRPGENRRRGAGRLEVGGEEGEEQIARDPRHALRFDLRGRQHRRHRGVAPQRQERHVHEAQVGRTLHLHGVGGTAHPVDGPPAAEGDRLLGVERGGVGHDPRRHRVGARHGELGMAGQDLQRRPLEPDPPHFGPHRPVQVGRSQAARVVAAPLERGVAAEGVAEGPEATQVRSEERRVGKEWRARWALYSGEKW